MEIYKTRDVFTPATRAKENFVERAESISIGLSEALGTPGIQAIVFGRSGSGKSSLLRKLLKESHEREVVSRCTADKTMAVLLKDAFDQLDGFYVSAKTQSKSKKKTLALGLQFQDVRTTLASLRTEISASELQRVVEMQLNETRLAKFLADANACWVLEDFHKLDRDERKKLSQIMKVFMDLASEDGYQDVKIIATGAVGTAREVVALDPEMNSRVSEIEVPLMTNEELLQIIDNGERLLNIKIDPPILKGKIVSSAGGLASICHRICKSMCDTAGVLETCPEVRTLGTAEYDEAIQRWLNGSIDTLRKKYDKATKHGATAKFRHTKLILHAVAAENDENRGATFSEILATIRKHHPDYPDSNLTNWLDQLCSYKRDNVLWKDKASGRYQFTGPDLCAFVRALDRKKTSGSSLGVEEFLSSFVLQMNARLKKLSQSADGSIVWSVQTTQSDEAQSDEAQSDEAQSD